uniref:poly(ADP-ribose) glycohydrolase n=1 Tax=Grammatophora oceanica TaxID=210454 RepID=A0A7S1UV22_9STRA|mmetsp:Transcript_25/g.39  ORF Transcript_25/g.39 Transcript_25/m.39 type:complete len:462 (+) Transcript_25:321-1706(+)|eukprot:CAMPEP_0194037254 /NCGR_PEP_ID=MMETSP0009_2-20130614/9578_1 /TAXON_ID=210454 /ORGANISM="Grammatophora oceanica, Strain CCMP 410" /LENGTH=461 /DNA_ID=CAMNT_0038679329 /DNA_START=319 /DNA_END=1704 /DNA_ORIENTATION=-
MSSADAYYSLAPSLPLFEERALCQRLQTCRDTKELCRIIIENQNRTKGEDEVALLSTALLPGLCSAVDDLGGPELVYGFDDTDGGLYPRLIRAAAELKTLFPVPYIPTLSRKSGMKDGSKNNRSVPLSSRQIRCILANAFLCNLSRTALPEVQKDFPATRTIPHYGSLSWHLVFNSGSPVATARVKGLLLYLQQALSEDHDDERVITFHRSILDRTLFSLPKQLAETKTWTPVSFFHGGVELASDADAIVDFANEDLHIGAVWPSATQEELLFTIYPECFVGILFCETMDVNEAIMISGVREYCKTTGFQGSFRVTAPSYDKKPKIVLAMDASISDPDYGISDQCSGATRDRDISKAIAAFSCVSGKSVATGHWGCGAFGGDVYCKFLVQLIAASLCNVSSVVYCLVGHDSDMIQKDLQAIYDGFCKKQWTPEKVYQAMSGYHGPENSVNMRLFILQTFGA